MMPSIRRKLDVLAERRQEVAMLLAQPEVLDDAAKFRDLSREYAQLEPISQSLQAYDDAGAALAAAEAMLAEPDMRDLAQSEIDALRARREQLDRDLAALLLPKDERDDANIFLEVRAGTGGD